jgi:hypothetical protein
LSYCGLIGLFWLQNAMLRAPGAEKINAGQYVDALNLAIIRATCEGATGRPP